MAGVKGKSGRKPTRITEYKQWFDANPGKIVDLLEMLYERAITDQDREAAIYIIDRVAGKPKQSIDQRTMNIDFTPDDYIRLLPILNNPDLLKEAAREEQGNGGTSVTLQGNGAIDNQNSLVETE